MSVFRMFRLERMRAIAPMRFLAVAVAALTLAACGEKKADYYQGWVESDLVFVSPDEAGRVETLAVKDGDHVDKDALLFTLDADLQQADVMQADATTTNAKQALDRAEQLLRTNSGTQKTFEDAEAALRNAQARLNSAKTRLARRRAVSPVTGSVEQVYFRPGEMVPPGKPIIALQAPENVKLRFYVSEAQLPKLAIGAPVDVGCDGCATDLVARISFMSRTAEYTPPVIYSVNERSKLVFLVEARPERPQDLRVGQPISVRLRMVEAAR